MPTNTDSLLAAAQAITNMVEAAHHLELVLEYDWPRETVTTPSGGIDRNALSPGDAERVEKAHRLFALRYQQAMEAMPGVADRMDDPKAPLPQRWTFGAIRELESIRACVPTIHLFIRGVRPPGTSDEYKTLTRQLTERRDALAAACRLTIAELQRQPEAATETTPAIPAEQRVRDYINTKRQQGVDITNLTRDGIAAALDISGGKVSNCLAWQALSKEKKQAKIPPSPEDAVLKAARQGDWAAVSALQSREERRNGCAPGPG